MGACAWRVRAYFQDLARCRKWPDLGCRVQYLKLMAPEPKPTSPGPRPMKPLPMKAPKRPENRPQAPESTLLGRTRHRQGTTGKACPSKADPACLGNPLDRLPRINPRRPKASLRRQPKAGGRDQGNTPSLPIPYFPPHREVIPRTRDPGFRDPPNQPRGGSGDPR